VEGEDIPSGFGDEGRSERAELAFTRAQDAIRDSRIASKTGRRPKARDRRTQADQLLVMPSRHARLLSLPAVVGESFGSSLALRSKSPPAGRKRIDSRLLDSVRRSCGEDLQSQGLSLVSHV
jgi:hypothetical protein